MTFLDSYVEGSSQSAQNQATITILISFIFCTIYQLSTKWLKQEGWKGRGIGKMRNEYTIVAGQPEHTIGLQVS
jgi:hypothetical protein